ncbi:hypothetical protein [Lyngbya sp. PCC 8106]|nr:hypothetical protein [Lyngbya sp. PCC 8106]EAW36326.1 hypothetical protein L8106_23391 [Lyngbya sp. PCC 8106]
MLAVFAIAEALPVGGVSIIEMATHGPLMHCLADRSHLDPHLRSVVGG